MCIVSSQPDAAAGATGYQQEGEGSENTATGGERGGEGEQASGGQASGDVREEKGGEGVNVAGLVEGKEEQLHLKQLVEAHHIDIP